MRIVLTHSGTRGVATYCLNLSKSLQKLGHDVLIVSELPWQKERVPLFECKSIYLANAIPVVLNMKEALKAIQEFKPDVIHHHWPSGTFDVFFSRFVNIGTPLILTIHVSPYSRGQLFDLFFFMYFKWLKKYLNSIHSISCVSSFISEKTRLALGKNKIPLRVIYAGLDTDRFTPQKKNNDDILRLIFVGEIMPEKGVGTLIRAVMKARQQRNIELTIVGKGLLEKYFRVITRNHPYIKWRGFVRDQHTLADFFSKADLMVLPTKWDEAFAMVNIESLSCGTPVLAAKKGGIFEVIIPYKTGYLIENLTAESLCSAILSLDKDTLHSMAKSCRQTVLENYTLDIFGKNHETWYNSILKSKSGK